NGALKLIFVRVEIEMTNRGIEQGRPSEGEESCTETYRLPSIVGYEDDVRWSASRVRRDCRDGVVARCTNMTQYLPQTRTRTKSTRSCDWEKHELERRS